MSPSSPPPSKKDISRSPGVESKALRFFFWQMALPMIVSVVLSVALIGAASASAAVVVIPSGAKAVSAGFDDDCAVMADGSARCWGSNTAGELGNGETTTPQTPWSSGPVVVSGLADATAISADSLHTCALLSDGTARCWGDNEYGELGDGTKDHGSPVPVSVSGLTTATAISAGGFHTCALLSGGMVKCWGENESGQLGDGSFSSGTVGASATPVSVSGFTTATAISARRAHTCALLSGGMVKCWGENEYGQLGDGTTNNSATPVQVSGLGNAMAISTGEYQTCALLSGGTARCWGRAELGDGTQNLSPTPSPVSGVTNATEVTVGVAHACVLLYGGTAECWGENEYGQLGDGTTNNSATPVAVDLSGILEISAGYGHTCVLLAGGAVECWGRNYGSLESAPSTPPQVTITKHPPAETSDQTPTFGFKGVSGGSYECSIDHGAWSSCKSGQSFGPLQPGDHLFQVREKLKGVTGPAASYHWTIDLPRACVLKVARARVFAFTHQSRARLVIHYKAYRPARVRVSYSLRGTRGRLTLGTASSHFRTAGIFRLGEKLAKADAARLWATKSMKVRFSIPRAPTRCTRYYTKRLTIPKKVFGQTVWFQSDSIFAS